MKSVIAILRQEAIGIINLSLPILAIAYFNPAKIPGIILSGHLNGKTRADYLRKLF